MRIPADVHVAFAVMAFSLGMGFQSWRTPVVVKTEKVVDHVAASYGQAVAPSCTTMPSAPAYSITSTSNGTVTLTTTATASGATTVTLPSNVTYWGAR